MPKATQSLVIIGTCACGQPATVKTKVGISPGKWTEPKTQCEACAEGELPKLPDEPKPFDAVGFIMMFECGSLSNEEIVEGFQHLIDTKLAWQLQGSYGRTAQALIEAGHCHQ